MIGPIADLAEGEHHAGCVIIPGFVNAHSHLEYAVYAGFGDGAADFSDWIGTHIERKQRLAFDDVMAIARLGVAECLASGITSVGDCAFNGAAALACAELGLRGIRGFLFQEGHDPAASAAFAMMARLTGGAHARFDVHAPASLLELLRGAAAYASGGREAPQRLADALRNSCNTYFRKTVGGYKKEGIAGMGPGGGNANRDPRQNKAGNGGQAGEATGGLGARADFRAGIGNRLEPLPARQRRLGGVDPLLRRRRLARHDVAVGDAAAFLLELRGGQVVQVQEDVRLAPQMPNLPKAMLNEKPKVESAGLEQLAKIDAGARSAMEKELTSITQGLLKESPRAPRQPLVSVAGGNKRGSGDGEFNANIPGLKSLHEALASTGPLPAGDKPIGMPGGALFEYNSYDLRSDSIDELKKLGTLIQRNPGATFSIEGHTDSFGPPEYNQKLSEQRAESVKIWLVEMMKISPQRIQTKGYGNTKWIVSPDKTKEEQAPNRRVEIVVKTSRR